jgi:hypothetical protein
MIPKVQRWRIRILAEDGKAEEILFMDGPTKALIRIGFRMDYPQHWGRAFKVSLARSKK